MTPLQTLLSPDDAARLAGGALPEVALRRLLRAAFDGLECALCLHRVAPAPRATDWQQGLSIAPEALDALVALLRSARPGAGRWLTLSFDDGYADAADYVRTRAPRLPEVDFHFFVCPEKVERGAGFRWDLAEEVLAKGTPRDEALALCDAPSDVDSENARPELLALARRPQYRLATLDEVRALSELPNVTLGNHTNLHRSPNALADEVARADYRKSTADFERLFGPQRHFAFPYGTPGHHFSPRHVGMLRALGDFTVWTTEARPFDPGERAPGAVLPRFPVDGSKPPKQTAGWLAARALDFRVRRRRRA